jgi:hypothetical protein
MGPGVPDGPLAGTVTLAEVTVGLALLVGAILHQHEIARAARRLRDRLRPPPERPAGRPIDRIASDVRRVRRDFYQPAPGLPMARRIALSKAYDDLLLDACRALGVPDTLSALPLGTERDAERLHVESQLTRAGLRLTA